METRWAFHVIVVFLLLLAFPAFAQSANGYVGPIEQDASSLDGKLPSVNLPQPGWVDVQDIQISDGTVSVPPCDDPAVIATVRDGIMATVNRQFRSSGGTGDIITTANLGPVWVHPTYGGGFVCDMQVQTDLPMTGADDWKFETFANDGIVKVFFMDVNGQ